MPKGLYVAYTHPSTPGAEGEMNNWYSQCHLPEILRLEGVQSASRYRSLDPNASYSYLATYVLEGEDLQEIVDRIHADGPNRTPTQATRKEPPAAFALFEFIEHQESQDSLATEVTEPQPRDAE